MHLRCNDVVTGFFNSGTYRKTYANRTYLMADHQHGSRDTTVQENTYNGFMTFVSRVAVVLIGLAVFLAIFAT